MKTARHSQLSTLNSPFKQTEVGVIPEDWDVVPIGKAGQVLGGRQRSPHYVGELCKYLRVTNVFDGFIDTDDILEMPFSAAEKERFLLKDGDILLNEGQSIELVGRSAIYRDTPEDCCFQNTLVRFRAGPSVYPEFAYLVFQQYLRTGVFASIALQTTSIAHLGAGRLAVLKMPLPTKAEQEAIAEALSDADALIKSLEQLIAKRRQIRQGAVQELLRPKDGWEPISLDGIADPNQRWSFTGSPFGSNLKSSDYTDEGVRILQLQNIGDGEFEDEYEIYTSTQKADELLSCNIYPGNIILSKMGDPVARACIIPAHCDRYLMCSDGIRLAVDQKRFNTYFVYAVINAPNFRTKAENASTGSTRKRIGLTELRNLELLCPSLPEQTDRRHPERHGC